ncbi:MAG TPA: hypothetical protein VES73_02365, partial [Lamprocystis sp. (in: g-proteobacteria)]|nr:hypothetical protein [Lamprocystis sp. (in: g-proteobacteria)]
CWSRSGGSIPESAVEWRGTCERHQRRDPRLRESVSTVRWRSRSSGAAPRACRAAGNSEPGESVLGADAVSALLFSAVGTFDFALPFAAVVASVGALLFAAIVAFARALLFAAVGTFVFALQFADIVFTVFAIVVPSPVGTFAVIPTPVGAFAVIPSPIGACAVGPSSRLSSRPGPPSSYRRNLTRLRPVRGTAEPTVPPCSAPHVDR